MSGELKLVVFEDQLAHTVHQLSVNLLEIASVDSMFQHVGKSLVDDLGFNYCSIFLLHENKFQPLKEIAWGTAVEAFKADEIDVLLKQTKAHLPSPLPIFLKKQNEQCRSIIALLSYGRLQGLLILDWLEDEKRSQFFNNFSSVLSTILHLTLEKELQVKRYNETISQLKHSEKVQSSLFAITEIAHSSEDHIEFYKGLHQIIGQLMYSDNLFIAIFDEEKNLIHFPYFIDTVDNIDPNEFFSEERLRRTITGLILRERKALLANTSDLLKLHKEDYIDLIGSAPVSWLGVPFFSDRGLSGAIVVQSYLEKYKFGEKDKELLIYVSQHIGEALRRKLDEENLHHRAMHDALTGLPNRHLLLDRLKHALSLLERKKENYVAILFLDLDRFKAVNDTFGHIVGDGLLKEVSQVIQQCLRKGDTLGRIGGDEFAIVLDSLTDLQHAELLAERIIQALEEPKLVCEHKILISTSIGISSTQDPGQTAEEILCQADEAMYKAKSRGRGCYCVYEDFMSLGNNEKNNLESEIIDAIESAQLEMYYQPIICINSGVVHGFESLVRWFHPDRGLIRPDAFIPKAEKSDLILKIDWHVLEQVICQLKIWLLKHPQYEDLSISVNISGKHLSLRTFPEKLQQLLDKYTLSGSSIKLEITEHALVENVDSVFHVIKELNDMDVHLMLDDFGTGYSSLSYLHKFSMNTVKVDRSFISDMSSNPEDNHVIKAIFALADAMDINVVVEGVEQGWQLECLQQMGGKYVQGFLVSKPVTADQVHDILNENIDYSSLINSV